jgi:7,8-dihydropterin-6-yl-methyl-4-(beta-D-ribofuranosyl)aminobenzene 5'-phosphate synthase
MRVTALIENETSDGCDHLQSEHGLSLHIETAGTTVLFDTGSSGAFADNAAALGIDLAGVDLAVLSHQHYDHGGGLRRFFDVNAKARVYLRDCAVDNRFFKALAVFKHPIGLDHSVVDDFPERYIRVSEPTEVAPGVWLLTEIGNDHPRPKGNRRLFVEHDGALTPDPFDHELVMAVLEDDGMVIFTGCSHSGILNMVESATARFPETPVKAVFGGFHLVGIPKLNTMPAGRPEVEEIAGKMMGAVDGTVFTGHCTGRKALDILAGVMGDTLRPLATGASVEV